MSSFAQPFDIGVRVAYRIEFFKGSQLVMALACPKTLDDAKTLAQSKLAAFGADKARIRDMDREGHIVGMVEAL